MSGTIYPSYPWSSGQKLGAEQLDQAFNSLYDLYNSLANSVGLIQTAGTSNDPVEIVINWAGGAIVSPGDYVIELRAPFAYTLTSLDYDIGSAGGSFTVQILNNETPVQGLEGVFVSVPGVNTTTSTGSNFVLAGTRLDMVISGVSGNPTDTVLAINGIRSSSGAFGVAIDPVVTTDTGDSFVTNDGDVLVFSVST